MVLSQRAQSLVNSIMEWVKRFPPGIIDVSQQPIPSDDDYGLESIIQLTPSNADACPIEIGVTSPEAGSAVYISLDQWSSIGERCHLIVTPRNIGLIGLYVEPIQLSIEKVIDICQAVSIGDVFLEVGVLFGRLVCTAGYVRISSGRFLMNGPCDYMTLVRIASLTPFGKILHLNYSSWILEPMGNLIND